MAKKLTGLGDELKQLIARCESIGIDDWLPLAHQFAQLMETRRAAHEKLILHIRQLIQAGAQGTSTADFANDTTVQKSLGDITRLVAQIEMVVARWIALSVNIGKLVGQIDRLIAKVRDLEPALPELKAVGSAAKELRAAVMELRDPGAIPQPRLDFREP